MKSLLLISLLISSISFANQKQEKVTCFVGSTKVSESLRTTLSDENVESRTTISAEHQEMVIVVSEKSGNIEIQKSSGTYVTTSASSDQKISVQKIDSTDTYHIDGNRKTLIKSVVDGKELVLYSIDTEVQVTDRLKIYTSVLKDKASESNSLKATYTCYSQVK